MGQNALLTTDLVLPAAHRLGQSLRLEQNATLASLAFFSRFRARRGGRCTWLGLR